MRRSLFQGAATTTRCSPSNVACLRHHRIQLVSHGIITSTVLLTHTRGHATTTAAATPSSFAEPPRIAQNTPTPQSSEHVPPLHSAASVLSAAIAPVKSLRMREALHHVVPQRFPVKSSAVAAMYDVRLLVQHFRDELAAPPPATTGASSTSGDVQRVSPPLTLEFDKLSSLFAFDTQYPSPVAPSASHQHPRGSSSSSDDSSSGGSGSCAPHVWRQQHCVGGLGAAPLSASTAAASDSRRMAAVVVRSRKTNNVFTIFGSGIIVAFGSGDIHDAVFCDLTDTKRHHHVSHGTSPTTAPQATSTTIEQQEVQSSAADFEEEFYDDIGDATGEDEDELNVDESAIAEADQLLLSQRSLVLAQELVSLQRCLRVYHMDNDPLLTLPMGEPVPFATLQYTTMSEMSRRHSDSTTTNIAATAAGAYYAHPPYGGVGANVLHFSPSLFDFKGHHRHYGGHDTAPHLESFHATTMPRSSQTSEKFPSYAVDNQFLVLTSPSPKHMLPFAFSLAERLHLRTLEKLLIPIVAQAAVWKGQLTKEGKPTGVPLHAARKAKAQVLRISSRHGKLGLTRHRLFWESHLSVSRGVFHQSCAHFEVFTIHDALRDQLDSLAKTLAYVCDEAHADTNHRLEWIIIAIIAFELLNSARHAYDHQMERRFNAAASEGRHA